MQSQMQSQARNPSHRAVVGMGSNVGDREAALLDAIRRLDRGGTQRVRAVSSPFETEPFGNADQPWFLNCVAVIETAVDLEPFFAGLQRIEAAWGRTRAEHWGPRTLDLDLLYFDACVSSDPRITLPHPGIAHRRFVLEPLSEVAPDAEHPLLGLSSRELLARTSDASRVLRRTWTSGPVPARPE